MTHIRSRQYNLRKIQQRNHNVNPEPKTTTLPPLHTFFSDIHEKIHPHIPEGFNPKTDTNEVFDVALAYYSLIHRTFCGGQSDTSCHRIGQIQAMLIDINSLFALTQNVKDALNYRFLNKKDWVTWEGSPNKTPSSSGVTHKEPVNTSDNRVPSRISAHDTDKDPLHTEHAKCKIWKQLAVRLKQRDIKREGSEFANTMSIKKTTESWKKFSEKKRQSEINKELRTLNKKYSKKKRVLETLKKTRNSCLSFCEVDGGYHVIPKIPPTTKQISSIERYNQRLKKHLLFEHQDPPFSPCKELHDLETSLFENLESQHKPKRNRLTIEAMHNPFLEKVMRGILETTINKAIQTLLTEGESDDGKDEPNLTQIKRKLLRFFGEQTAGHSSDVEPTWEELKKTKPKEATNAFIGFLKALKILDDDVIIHDHDIKTCIDYIDTSKSKIVEFLKEKGYLSHHPRTLSTKWPTDVDTSYRRSSTSTPLVELGQEVIVEALQENALKKFKKICKKDPDTRTWQECVFIATHLLESKGNPEVTTPFLKDEFFDTLTPTNQVACRPIDPSEYSSLADLITHHKAALDIINTHAQTNGQKNYAEYHSFMHSIYVKMNSFSPKIILSNPNGKLTLSSSLADDARSITFQGFCKELDINSRHFKEIAAIEQTMKPQKLLQVGRSIINDPTGPHKVVILVGPSGVGKSTVAKKYCGIISDGGVARQSPVRQALCMFGFLKGYLSIDKEKQFDNAFKSCSQGWKKQVDTLAIKSSIPRIHPTNLSPTKTKERALFQTLHAQRLLHIGICLCRPETARAQGGARSDNKKDGTLGENKSQPKKLEQQLAFRVNKNIAITVCDTFPSAPCTVHWNSGTVNNGKIQKPSYRFCADKSVTNKEEIELFIEKRKDAQKGSPCILDKLVKISTAQREEFLKQLSQAHDSTHFPKLDETFKTVIDDILGLTKIEIQTLITTMNRRSLVPQSEDGFVDGKDSSERGAILFYEQVKKCISAW